MVIAKVNGEWPNLTPEGLKPVNQLTKKLAPLFISKLCQILSKYWLSANG